MKRRTSELIAILAMLLTLASCAPAEPVYTTTGDNWLLGKTWEGNAMLNNASEVPVSLPFNDTGLDPIAYPPEKYKVDYLFKDNEIKMHVIHDDESSGIKVHGDITYTFTRLSENSCNMVAVGTTSSYITMQVTMKGKLTATK